MSSSSKPAQTMAELMARNKDKLVSLKKGQKVTGTITTLTSQEILIELEDKTIVVAIEKDRKQYKQLLNFLKVGDKVEAIVLYPESDSGYPAITLREFMKDKMWEILENLKKSGEKINVTVLESTKGGLVVEMDNGMNGFLPNSHIAGNKIGDLVGQRLSVGIVELSRENRKIVFSQKSVLTSDDFKEIALKYKLGEKAKGKIASITTFGLFVSLPFKDSTVDGLVHISEVSWEKVEDLNSIFSVGQEVEAKVIGVDPRSKRIDLSIKKLTSDPFQKILDNFPVDKKVVGTALDMTESGLEIDLGQVDGILVEGLMKKDKIPPTKSYEKGQKVDATVVSVDSRKRKVMLTPVLKEKPLMYR